MKADFLWVKRDYGLWFRLDNLLIVYTIPVVDSHFENKPSMGNCNFCFFLRSRWYRHLECRICPEKKNDVYRSWNHSYHDYHAINPWHFLNYNRLLFISNFIFNVIILILGPQLFPQHFAFSNKVYVGCFIWKEEAIFCSKFLRN